MIFDKFKNIPWTSLSDDQARERFGNNLWASIAIDTLDGELWSSRVSFIGNIIILSGILLSTITYILTNGNDLTNAPLPVIFIEYITGTLLLIEILLRIHFAKYLGFNKSVAPAIAYLFSFIGLIDLLSLFPYLTNIAGISLGGSLAFIRILRLWRITRFIPAFRGVSDAFKSRKDEILVTLLAVVLLSLTLSAIMFHAEKTKGSEVFSSIIEVFIWSMGKYTGDYGAIAGAVPITVMGKLVATINGLLGIALFAIPSGILASAFIDQLSEKRRLNEIKERYSQIQNYFDNSVGGGKHLLYKANYRFASFDTLQAKFVFSDEQLFEAIRESSRLRFRAMKSSPDLRYNDTRIIECFHQNCSYGYRNIRSDSSVMLINPVGEVERGISHFAFTLGTNCPISFVSREITLYNGENKIGSNKSIFYPKYILEGPDHFSLPFTEFMRDLTKADSNSLIVILSSAASGRNHVVLEYGNEAGDTSWNSSTSTFSSAERMEEVRKIIADSLQSVSYRSQSEKNIERSFTLEENTIGLSGNESLLRTTRNSTGADVIAIPININLLIGEDGEYYTLLTAFGKMMEKLQLIYS